MALLILDSSVLIAWFDERDALHERVMALLKQTRSDERVVPATAHAESLVAPSRLGDEAVKAFNAALDALPARVVPIDRAIARRAAAMRARHSTLRFADALVLATAQELDGVAVTGDRSWRKFDRDVQVL